MDRDDIIGNLVEQDTGLDIYTDRAQSPAVNVVAAVLVQSFCCIILLAQAVACVDQKPISTSFSWNLQSTI